MPHIGRIGSGSKLRLALLFVAITVFASLLSLQHSNRPTFERPTRSITDDFSSQTIPKIYHASWKSKTLPPLFAQLRNASLKHFPTSKGWTHHLHTDRDNYNLIKTHFPQHLPLYQSFPNPIMKADLARLFYMRHYGGVYADLDVEFLDSVEEALAMDGTFARSSIDTLGEASCVAGRIYRAPQHNTGVGSINSSPHRLDPTQLKGGSHCARSLSLALLGSPTLLPFWPHSLPNAFLASVPNHPFWSFAIDHVYTLWKSHLDSISASLGYTEGFNISLISLPEFRTKIRESPPEYITGPGHLRSSLLSYLLLSPENTRGVTLLGPEVIFPYDWDHKREFDEVCSAQKRGFDRRKCCESVCVGKASLGGKKFENPKLVEVKILETIMEDGEMEREIVPGEVVEVQGESVRGSVAVSYWRHSWSVGGGNGKKEGGG